MSATRSIYKVVRSVLFSVILTAVGIIAAIYVIVSLPGVQSQLRDTAEYELARLLGGKVVINKINFLPFNELRLNDVSIFSPSGQKCISVGTLGAGIDLWELLTEREIVITYAEIVSLNALIEQERPDTPMNIQFLVDAFKPQKKKQPSQVRVVLHNVVIRKSSVTFRRKWHPLQQHPGKFDFNNLAIYNLNADVALPVIDKDSINIKLRRLAFIEKSGLDIRKVSLNASISPRAISFNNFRLQIGTSKLQISDQMLAIEGYKNIIESLKHQNRIVRISGSPIYLPDFESFVPIFSSLRIPLSLKAEFDGNYGNVFVNGLEIHSDSHEIDLGLSGKLQGLSDFSSLRAAVSEMKLHCSFSLASKIVRSIPDIPSKLNDAIRTLGDIDIYAQGELDNASSLAKGIMSLETSAGNIEAQGEFKWPDNSLSVSDGKINADNFALGDVLGIANLGNISLLACGNMHKKGKDFDLNANADADFIEYNGNRIEHVTANIDKCGKTMKGSLDIPDADLGISLNADIILDGIYSKWNIDGIIDRIRPAHWGVKGFKPDETISGAIITAASGNDIDNLQGNVTVSNARLTSTSRPLSLDRLELNALVSDNNRQYTIKSDWIDACIDGNFNIADIRTILNESLHNSFPLIFEHKDVADCSGQYADIMVHLSPPSNLFDALKFPIRPVEAVDIKASVKGTDSSATFVLDAPYLLKGRNNLIKGTHITGSMGVGRPLKLDARTSYPVKHDIADLRLALTALSNQANLELGWTAQSNHSNQGAIGLEALLSRNLINSEYNLDISLLPSEINLNGAEWKVHPAKVIYNEKALNIEGVHIAHDAQYININGKASNNPLDVITATLAGIDLQYVFDILNINHVDFGGIATGKAKVSSLFSGTPVANTEHLTVKDLAYNGCVLGNADLYGYWDNAQKMVGINADVAAADTAAVKVRGGIFVTRDSLTFDFNAHKADLRLLQPFMSGFTSSIKGKASGHVKLYGTFSEIDLGGRAYADTVTMKVDHTNVSYSGSDSIIFSKGRIDIPSLRLYDKYGNSALFSGNVRHKFLKDVYFDFELKNARHLLVFDTDARINPAWNGKVFASGNAKLRGLPGIVALDVKMNTDKGTVFNIQLDETRTASEYNFLTFSDKKAELMAKEKEVESFEEKFRKNTEILPTERPSLFTMDLAIDVNQYADLILVMDPATGDKICANGNGALQMHYDTDTDDYSVYGKYTLDRGTYNFSLQDLILKNFTIRTGSSISFNGDPMNGNLDITAAYRVNTNLADLDISFKDDPDLKRTTVPVDALLKVTGDIQAPEINFDLSLPTVTAEVERKLHSLISTEDMLNRQVIYLLALNRFYSPDYAGNERGGELASVASSTLSSQIQNIIGSLTDKVNVAPSIKSDRSDLSDMEFDVALSSRLFDDRLLINGNLGYRDKSTSQTTFIGDFDIEYLLTRNGQLRLKAYNHFNDASYYLKSALTTQGIGMIYRKDFDDPFSFLKHKKKPKKFKSNQEKNKQEK